MKSISQELSKKLDPILVNQLIQEFIDLEESFALMKWKYTELDGGRFCEVSARLLYSMDSQNLNRNKPLDDCLKYVDNDKVLHNFPDRRSAIHLSKVLRSIYKLRSQRGGVHVTPDYTADEIDSRLITENCRWVMVEILRIFWNSDKIIVAGVIREISRFRLPFIREYGGKLSVQKTDLTTEEEILVLLLNAGAHGMTGDDLIAVIPKDSSGIRKSLKNLYSGKLRQIMQINKLYQITDLGIKRIEAKVSKQIL